MGFYDRFKVLKANPNHDQRGRFSTAQASSNALGKSRSMARYYDSHDDHKVTVADVLSNFSEADRKKVENATHQSKFLVQTVFTVKNPDGSYKEARKALHKEIFDSYINEANEKEFKPPAGERPTFAVLGGRGGSGKSGFTDGTIDQLGGRKFLKLDTDDIKQRLRPPYKGWNAFQVHSESVELFDAINAVALDKGMNVLHDGTLSSDHYTGVFKNLPERYRKEAHYMFVDRKTAAIRSTKRFLDPSKGRLVPPHIILENTKNEQHFEELKPYLDHWSAYDNMGAKPKFIDAKPKEKTRGR